MNAIFIIGIEGKTMMLPINGQDKCKISDLRVKVENNAGVPAENQRLLYQDKELEDIQRGKVMTLADYEIDDGASIFLETKLQDKNVTSLKEESSLSQVDRVRSEIKTNFTRAHEALQEREHALLSELEVSLESAKDRLKSVDLQWNGELVEKLSEMGKIKIEVFPFEVQKENGVFQLEETNEDYIKVASKFRAKWNINKGSSPSISTIFRVNLNQSEDKFNRYIRTLRHDNANLIEYYFHGCKITCNLLNAKSLCNRPDCTVCLISKQGFDINKVGTNVAFTRFGRGLYFAPESSKCHDYTLGIEKYGYRAMFCVKCAPGFKQVTFVDDRNRTAPDKGYDSLYGLAGGGLNYDELCLYNDSACVPGYIIIYYKDGVDRRCF